MKSTRALAWLGIVVLVSIFTAVFVNVLKMRVAAGDIYPQYSTNRHDPIGSSGLFESLGQLPQFTTRRNGESLMRISDLDGDSTLFLLGIPRFQFNNFRAPDESPVLQAVENDGARLVMTINPQSVPLKGRNIFSDEDDWWERRREIIEKEEKEEEEKKKEASKGKKKKADKGEKENDKKEDDEEDESWREKLERERDEELGYRLSDHFGIKIDAPEEFKRPESGWETTVGETIDSSTPPKTTPTWYSHYRLEPGGGDEKEWKPVVLIDKEPVVMERKYGKGSIVITTDSFFASNEALFKGANSDFLLFLTGGKSKLIFDETIHGTTETLGTMEVIRSYRLHGFLIGGIIFVLLWAWRSASSLAPGDESVELGLVDGSGTVSGADAKTGFVTLLRRSVPGKELIDNCLAIWKKSQFSDLPAEKQRQIDQLMSQHRTNPKEHTALKTYRAISTVLKRR